MLCGCPCARGLAEYEAQQLPSGKYELKVRYSSDDDLDTRMHELLGDIAGQADEGGVARTVASIR